MAFITKIYNIILILVLAVILFSFSCIPQQNPDPNNIEGVQEGETSTEGPQEGQTEGEIEGQTEGTIEEATTFTSAVTYDPRNVDYGVPETTTDGEDTSERELIEPDVIRKWDNYLLVLNQFRGLTIVDLTDKMVLSNLPIHGYPRDLYIKDSYAVVLIGYTISHTIEDDVIIKTTGAKAIIVDITNLSEPKIISSISLPGDFIDSRVVGNILYAVTSDYYYEYVSNSEEPVSSDSTWSTQSGSQCWITSIDLNNPSSPEVVERVNFPGYGTIIQATNHSIYVCTSEWYSGNTLITYIDISNPYGEIIQYPAVEVPGYIADKFKLDEWQNYLRVVSNTWWENRNTFITVFDVSNPADITLCSQTLLPEAQGETLYATRFAENYLYLVTYLTIDPLFVVDLSNPYKPEVKGVLHVPGWSVHIEPAENHQLIALGVDDQNNQRRVKVSWFDVSDPSNPTEVSTVSIGEGWTWSSAYSDVKAFTILDDYIIVPFTGWSENYYREQLQFIKWQYEDRELLPLGAVNLNGQALRTIKHTDYFYSITTQYIHEIVLNSNEQPILTGVDIPLAEYVTDVIEINNANNLVEIVSDTEKGMFTLRLKNTQNEILDFIDIKTNGYFSDAVKITEDIIGIVLNECCGEPYYESYYRAILVKINEIDSSPKIELIRDDKVPLTPLYYWGYLLYDFYPIRFRPYPYYWYYGDNVPNEFIFSAYNKLIIRGRADTYNITIGDEATPSEGFAIIDISPEQDITTVGLGFSNIVNMIESSGRIFLTTQKYLDSTNPPLTSYYLSEISLNPPKVTDPINVPGIITSINQSKGIYFLKDWQYINYENPSPEYYYPQYETWFRSIEIINGKVNILDSVNTKSTWAQFYHEISDYLLYLTTQDNLLTIRKYDISDEGKFKNYAEKILGSSIWGDIVHTEKPYAYISIDSTSIAILNLNSEEGIQFADLIPLNSYPSKYRIGKDYIYIISGYGGWSKIGLLSK